MGGKRLADRAFERPLQCGRPRLSAAWASASWPGGSSLFWGLGRGRFRWSCSPKRRRGMTAICAP